MATLDMQKTLQLFDMVLKFHSTRVPSEGIERRLGESLFESRRIAAKARIQFTNALALGRGSPVAIAALKHHFKVDPANTTEHIAQKVRIMEVLKDTHEGLAGRVTLSDVLCSQTWDEYRWFARKETDTPALPGTSRPGTSVGEEGHVKPKPTGGFGSIHIEFSLAANYPRLQLARVIVHEATHKFSHTVDHAYTYNVAYENLTVDQRVQNADSYAYAALSVHLGSLIQSYEDAFRMIPQYGAPHRENPVTLKTVLTGIFKSLFG